ncbi:hypothetical protein Acr_00g0056800 [Actinidia rufa]|uniref:Uncharacterized protein n=1 Tax=Actinidia rufa TaxID=165716 RepID=A0A7J0DMF9_9ERIC|nr:hypothetical protein Acr_00g0056800 [Actinidia rufa]
MLGGRSLNDVVLPPLNTPIAQKIWQQQTYGRRHPSDPWRFWIRGMFKRHVKEANGQAEEEVYNLISPLAIAHQPITFTNDDLRGNTTYIIRWIRLLMTLGTEPHQTIVWKDFIIVDCPSPYNAIFGYSTLGKIKAVTSTGIGEVKGNHKVAKQCFISAMKAESSSKLGDK